MSDTLTHNIHDSFFRKTLSHRDVAADFLSNYLPAPVLQHIELDSLAICKETFVDTKQAAHYYDFSPRANEVIKGQMLLQSALYCLKAAHHRDAPSIVLEIFKCIGRLDDDEYTLQWVQMIWQYVSHAVDVKHEEVAKIVQQNLSDKKEGVIMTLAQRLEQRGREEGILLGRTEGRTEILTHLLTRKFGAQTLTPAVQQRLRLGTTDQLDYWGERILDAKSVAEVFMDH